MDCEVCREMRRKSRLNPTCSDCARPQESLGRDAEAVFQAWQLADIHDREYWQADGAPLPLKLESLHRAAKLHRIDADGLEMMIALEHVALGIKRERHEARVREKKKNA